MNNKGTIFVISSILLDCFIGFVIVGLIISISAKSDKIAEVQAQNSSLIATNTFLSDSIAEKDNEYARLEEKYREKIQECNDEYEKSCALWEQAQEYRYELYELYDKISELESKEENEDVIQDSLSSEVSDESIFVNNAYNLTISNEDFIYLCRCVESETHNRPVKNKANVVSVVLNRVKTGWGSTVKDVITAKNQFAYKRSIEDITTDTVEAIISVLKWGDTTNGALYFHSSKYPVGYFKKYNADYMFTDEVGHSFYK